MPEEVNGYELFQLCDGDKPEESIAFAEYDIDLGEDGYGAQLLYGADTGHRRWRITYPTLAGASGQANVTMNGVTMTPEMYLWDLFCRGKVSGEPFVVTSPRNDQYYLAKFADRELNYGRFLTKLFSTGLELKQVRLPGVSVFDPLLMNGLWGWFEADSWTTPGPGIYQWTDLSGAGHTLTTDKGESGIQSITDELNGHDVFRFNEGGATEGFFNTTQDPVIYEALFLIKMHEPVLSSFQGILTASVTLAAFIGNNGDTKLVDLEFGSMYTYRKDGVLLTEATQNLPMEQFGLIHGRWEEGVALANLQIGKDRDFAGRYGQFDLAGFGLFSTLQPLSESFQLAEHMQTKWDV